MRSLLAIALLALAVASAHHTPQHTLRGPRFLTGKLYRYDVEYNVTSGVLGLSSQVSKAAFKAEVSIYAKSAEEHLLKIEKVYTSGSIKAIDGKLTEVTLKPNPELQDRLAVPIKFTLDHGKVTKYTLSPRDNLESKKIKRSILRSLEMHVDETALLTMESDSEMKIPVSYNRSESTTAGSHMVHYMITVSPYAEFPDNQDVYNITRTDDFEGQRYPAYRTHHNFQQQGCPEVCRKDWRSNEYCAGCPMGYEPHHSPIKMSFNHEHHLTLKDNIMNPEIIRTTEAHVAQMYDQDMEVLLLFQMRRKKISTGSIVEPSDQTTHEDLQDWTKEINEKEIDELCRYKTSEDSIISAGILLNNITDVVVAGNLDTAESKLIGQKLILLKAALMRLSAQDLDKVRHEYIQAPVTIQSSSQEVKVKRQIWLDMLPLIGTENSVTYIVQYLKEALNNEEMMIWEAKEILESLPQNIHRPSDRTVKELYSLITDETIKTKMGENHVLHSAAHLSLARVIGFMCGNATLVKSSKRSVRPWFSYRQSLETLEAINSPPYGPPKCAVELAEKFVNETIAKLKNTDKKDEVAIYLETLAHIGMPEVLPTLAKYVYGTFSGGIKKMTESYIDFVKSIALYALHNVAAKHPEEVLHIVLPVYFNLTENPKVRNAAFGVLLRCQPSLEILQHVAIKSWAEPSQEVGSYVTSTLESFGNSSLPCMQLTSHRIKKVMPQVKRFNIGSHHSKNLLWTYFDENREFGLEGRMEYTQNNASFIPSALYKSLAYSTDSLRDVLMQMALNVQGVTYDMLWKAMEKHLNIGKKYPFTKLKENEIFGNADVQDRIPDALRFTIYKRIFYASSYYYLDSDNSRILRDTLAEYLRTYLKTNSYEYDGHLVKVFLPSSYHTMAIAKTLPYPVEFEMKQPLLLALKVMSYERSPRPKNFRMYFRPSIYYTRLFTNQIKNIGDCKEVGVYHEHKMAFTWPFDLEFRGFNLPNLELKYKKPELNKQIFTFFSESGTYAAKKTAEALPSTSDREPILTQPTPFKFERKINLVSIPPMRMEAHSEDIAWDIERLPRNIHEAFQIITRRVMNAGWRHKSYNVTLYEDSSSWPMDTEVTFKLEYDRKHFARYLNLPSSSMPNSEDYYSQPEDNEWTTEAEPWDSKPHWLSNEPDEPSWNDTPKDDDWIEKLNPGDIRTVTEADVIIEQAKKADFSLYSIPHISHILKVKVETKPLHTSASFEVKYNHTYSKTFHTVHMNGAVTPTRGSHEYKVTLDHVMAFGKKPNEFQYQENGGSQIATFITALGIPSKKTSCGCGWEYVQAAVKGVLTYKNLKELMQEDLWTDVDKSYFLPETHEACIEHTKSGKPASVECLKALKESSLYNQLLVSLLWKEEIPDYLKVIAKRADVYGKHYLFHHLDITEKKNTEKKVIVELHHINKLVDEPVFDIKIEKPDETVEFKRVPTLGFQPFSSIYTVPEAIAMAATNNTYPTTCTIMKDYVKTYDMKTYKFTAEQCNYVLSTHCARTKYFAITAKGLDSWHSGKGNKEVTLWVFDKKVVLTPPTSSVYKVIFNKKETPITSPVVLDETHEIYAYPEWTTSGTHLRVVARRAGVAIHYDGVNVEVKVDPKYKGELCGLCSEFDGETLREFRGVDQCLYTHPLDFANSAIIEKEGNCDKDRLYGKKICYAKESPKVYRNDENDDYENTVERNMVEVRGSEYCFSTLPMPVCADNARPLETETRTVAFHCLPKKDATAKRLVVESKARILGELAGRSVDFEEELDVAKRC